jgi:hypothetical protein
MNAITNNGKEYIHIIELHDVAEVQKLDEDIRDHKPNLKIACLQDSDLDWMQIMGTGCAPLVKGSPTIIKATLDEYVFTSEFWICNCEFDWLHAKQWRCEGCGTTVFDKTAKLKKVSDLDKWSPISFEHALLTMTHNVMEKKEIFENIAGLYQHCKNLNFNWIEAFNARNY